MRLTLVWGMLALGLIPAPCLPAGFEAGVGLRIITPDPLLPVSGGVGEPQPATGKQGELTARALVVRNGETTLAVVALDLLGFPSVLSRRVFEQVPRIPPENILIGSTHTHSAPDCYAFPRPDGGHTGDLEYMDRVCRLTAEAINEALDALQPAVLRVATDTARGKIAYNYYAPPLYDPRMSVLQVSTPEGEVIGTLVNYAVHPEVLGNDVGLLSPDLVGPLCDRIEERVGGRALFMNGAQGGMITADNRDFSQPGDPIHAVWPDLRTWAECLRIGHLMADEALRIIEPAAVQTDPEVTCTSRNVRFPVESDLMWGIILGSPLKYPHNFDQSITARINLVNLGTAQILTIPGEALPNIGFYLKRHMRGEHQLLLGLTNDAFGYIMTKVDFSSFERYNYISRTSLGEMTGEILIENCLDLIESSPLPRVEQ